MSRREKQLCSPAEEPKTASRASLANRIAAARGIGPVDVDRGAEAAWLEVTSFDSASKEYVRVDVDRGADDDMSALVGGLKDGTVTFIGEFEPRAPDARFDRGLDMVEVLTVTSNSVKALQLSFKPGSGARMGVFSRGTRLAEIRMPRWLADQHGLEHVEVDALAPPGGVIPPQLRKFVVEPQLFKPGCKVCGAPRGEACTESCDDDRVPDHAVQAHPVAEERERHLAMRDFEREQPSACAALPARMSKSKVATTDEATLADLLCEEVP